jgi:serine/threonine protein kinase/class 3 adenylate cyclase
MPLESMTWQPWIKEPPQPLKYDCTTPVLPRGHWLDHWDTLCLQSPKMIPHEDDVDVLLKARAEIDEQLRRHKNTLTVLFTDVAGSTSFFERNGDTAGLAMIHRHDELATSVVQKHTGRVIKTIGDSAMAEFPDPSSAVRAGVEIERQFLKLNSTLPQDQRVEVRIGVHSGVGFRKGNDLFGDVVNVAARIVKRTAPAQILISRAVYEAVSKEADLHCHWLSKFTIDGRIEKEDIFEVTWTDAEAYREVRKRLTGPSSIPSRYEVLSQVGTGGTGVVYKVRDLETDETVALKILKPEIATNPTVQDNFKRELCLARKITHKNVCRIHDFSRSNGTAYASMGFIKGESLLSRLNRVGSLPVNQAFEIARQICAGLREAHAQGIVHGDLKPANIMLDRSGTVKITDFGVARLIQDNGPMTGSIVGTPAYMAPEQAELKPVGPCTDIYALGLVLYEMITGSPAFHGDTPVAVALRQIREYPRRPRDIVPTLSHPIEAAILKCLQKDPAKRFQSVNELELALERAAKARAVAAWRVSVDRKLRRADMNVRRCLRHSVEVASAFMRLQDWRALTRIRTEPATALVVSVLLIGVIAVAVYGSGKSNANSAEPAYLSGASQSSLSSNAVTHRSVSELDQSQTPSAISVMTSHEVDLRRDSRVDLGKIQSPTAKSLNEDLGSEPTTPPVVSSQVSRAVKRKQTPARAEERKTQSNAQVPAQSQVLTSSVQPQTLISADTSQPAAPEATTKPPQPNIAPPDPILEGANPASVQKTAGSGPEPPTFYIEVGSFKDETWANNAVEKLTQLGFHALLFHKTLLWTQSFHVEVGPYTDPKDIEAARQSLASQGFKSHPVN